MVSAEMPRDESRTESFAPRPATRDTPADDLTVGQVVADRYRIVARLGAGGAAVVYQAFDQQTRMWMALKVLHVPGWSGPQATEPLFRELRFGRALQHPNVCRIYDVFEAQGRCFLAMEHASRGTLRESLRQPAVDRSLHEKLEDARATIAGVAAIHQAGLVHRDLKPENILRMEDGRLVVSDFGITRALEQTFASTRVTGTPGYLAPETVVEGAASQASDVWSLGVILHEILSGQRPSWNGSTWKPNLSGGADSREQALASVCQACLRANPTRRPQTAVEVERLLTSRLRWRFLSGPLVKLSVLLLALGAAVILLGSSLQFAVATGPCGREGSEICRNAGGTCERWPDSSEKCRWKDVPENRCGVLAREPLSPPNQGVWTTASAPGVTAGPGACLNPVPNLCRSSEWQMCKRFGAVACENRGLPICRWSSDEADCRSHSDKTCWGIWTTATDTPGRPYNAVPNGQDGACIIQFGNLTGTPCP